MSDELKFVSDDVVEADHRQIYGPMLKKLRESGREGWIELKTYDNTATAKDLAYRLRQRHPDFEIVSRGTGVYARIKEATDE